MDWASKQERICLLFLKYVLVNVLFKRYWYLNIFNIKLYEIIINTLVVNINNFIIKWYKNFDIIIDFIQNKFKYWDRISLASFFHGRHDEAYCNFIYFLISYTLYTFIYMNNSL